MIFDTLNTQSKTIPIFTPWFSSNGNQIQTHRYSSPSNTSLHSLYSIMGVEASKQQNIFSEALSNSKGSHSTPHSFDLQEESFYRTVVITILAAMIKHHILWYIGPMMIVDILGQLFWSSLWVSRYYMLRI